MNMSDIELVIKIPEETYIYLRNGGTIGASLMIENAIKNGTPLPKGHKALIDISNIDVIELEDSSHFIRHEKGDDVDVYISAPIIIEADREVNNENNNN
jgi:hypothetical protein